MERRWPIEITGVEPVRPLGSGGFGEVWLARQPALDRQVAVKIGHRPFTSTDDRRRFERECLALGRLSGHPHIVDVHTSGVIGGLPYLVLEYVDGGTLADDHRSRTETDLRRLTTELTSAVGAAHAIGVLHRDLKPENVFLRSSGASVLGDFGIARLGDGNNTSAPGVTASMAFAAPEILNGHPPTEQADVYGIGITIVSAVLGESPFVSGGISTLEAIVAAVLRGANPDLESRGLSPAFSALLRRTIDPDPARRPQSAEALAAELAALEPPRTGLSMTVAGGQAAASGLVADSADGAASAVRYRAPATLGSPAAFDAGSRPPSADLGQPIGGGGDHGQPSGGARVALTSAAAVIALGLVGGGSWLAFRDGNGEPPTTTTTTSAVDAEASLADSADDDDTSGIELPEVSVPIVSLPDISVGGAEIDVTDRSAQPLAIPLVGSTISSLTRIPIDTGGLDELVGPADSPQFCNNRPDITGLIETTAAIYPADPTVPVDGQLILVQVAQRMHRFETEAEAEAFVESYAALVDCESWEDDTLTSDGTSVLRATVVDGGEPYGDQIRRIDQVVTLPIGVEIHSRTVLVRSGVDVFKLFLTTDRADELMSAAEDLVAAAVDQLGY